MKRILSIIMICACFTLLLSSCGQDNTAATPTGPASTEFQKNDTDMFTERDTTETYDESAAIRIKLNGSAAESGEKHVEILGSVVTITRDGTYYISGNLTDGQIIINAPSDAKPHIILDSVSISSENTAPFYITSADKVFVTLKGESTLSNGGSFTENGTDIIDGTVWSRDDLTFNGDGTLTILSPGGHGVVCKDDLVLTGGNYSITSSDHGIDANDSVRIKTASITLDTGKDGIHVENTEDTTLGYAYISDAQLSIEAEGDGISASTFVQIENGTIDMLCGGGYENGEEHASSGWGGFGGRPPRTTTAETDSASTSMKGIKATSGVLISSGSFTLDTADDALHSNTTLTINGGSFTIASGDDALHADTDLIITAGDMAISTCYEGLEGHHVTVTGGNIKLKATDDGINAAGGNDGSGEGGRDNLFGGRPGGPGGFGVPGGGANSDGSITIAGGTLYIHSSGDGMDANGTLTISGGHTTVVGPTQGDTATLDYDVSGVITGGTFIGTGSANMAQSFSDAAQGVIAVSVGTQTAGTAITVTDKEGGLLLSYAPELSYQIIIISMPEMKSGKTYNVGIGGQSAEVEAD